MATEQKRLKVRLLTMEVQHVREMCGTGPNSYIAMSCASLLRLIDDIAPSPTATLDIAKAGGVTPDASSDPFADEEDEEDPFS